MELNRTVRVLIVDDSAFVRQALKEILETDPGIGVIAVAADPYVAVERIRAQLPDVITLDIEMPRMDGLTFLEKLMGRRPIPVVTCSTLTGTGSDVALAALQRVLSRSSRAEAGHEGVLRRITSEDMRHREGGCARAVGQASPCR